MRVPAADPALAAEQSECQRDLLNRLFAALPPGQGPGLLKELAGSLGFPATQEPAQEAETSRPTTEAEPAEGSGPKNVLKQTRIKSQGPYARHGESAPGAGVRSASALGAQEEGSPESLAEREAVGGRSRAVVNRPARLGRTAIGVILWLIASPLLRLGHSEGHVEPAREAQDHTRQQTTGSGDSPALRGTLRGVLAGTFDLPTPKRDSDIILVRFHPRGIGEDDR